MAFSVGTQWEARAGGSDTICSGGFNPSNANFATDGAATSATGNSAVFTSASYNFVAGDVGAWVFIKSGTNWNPGWYQIASVASNAATLSSAIGQGVTYPGASATTNGALQVATTIAGVATTASPTAATWGVDYSQQNSAVFNITDMVIDGTTNTKFTSVGHPVGKNFVGNLIKVTAGTGFTVQTVEVLSTVTTTATCDKSLGTLSSTGGNGYLGGAFAGPQLACGLALAGNIIWVASGAYTISSVTSNGALGKITMVAGTSIEGYGSTRGDLGTAPVFTSSGVSSISLFAVTNSARLMNITADGVASAGTITGFTMNGSSVYFATAKNCVTGFSNGESYKCTADTCTTGFSGAGPYLLCIAKTCTTGYSGGYPTHCVASGCTTGFTTTAGKISNSVAYNSTNGFVCTSGYALFFRCIAHTSSSRGFDFNTGSGDLLQCSAYLSTTADIRYNVSGISAARSLGFIALSVDPFTNASGGDFSLNNTANAGASLRGLAISFPTIITTTSYLDVGAVQHADPLATSTTRGLTF